ncbi:MAG: autotransporter-associated beta strand repeat-containing protein [Candidatus Didemnitutus sp.]|nr:autotransporter-associated beta strand repeat-containing protein [Candidatus Didemnitutus sp.]
MVLPHSLYSQVTLTNGQTLATSGTIGGSSFQTSVSQFGGTATLQATGNLSLGGNISVASNGTLTIDTNGYTISVGIDPSNKSLVTNTASIVKTGAGTLALSGKNSGSLTINQGAVTMTALEGSLNVTNAVATASAITGSGFSLNSGGTFRAGAAFTSATGSFMLNGADSTIDTNGFDVTLVGLVSGSGALNKAGSGALTLNSGSFTGGINVQAGTLKIADTNSSGGTVAISSGATLDLINTNRTIGQLSGAGNVTLGSATLTVNQSTNSELSGALSGTGGLTKSGTGTLTLSGTNTASGTTTVSAGTLQIGNGGTSGSLAGNITNNATLAFNRSDALTYSGVISGSGAVTKLGSGTLTLSGTNTYNGATTLSGGTLKLSGSAANSAFTVAGGTLSGSGTLGALTVDSGGTIAPGNSPGTLHAGATTFASGGTYLWEINNVNGTAGADPGWDLLSVTGGLTISATNVDPFTIDLTSLTSGNVAGLATGFSTSASYSFTLVSTTTGISGFSADKFNLNTSGFANSFDGTWALALANGGNDLALTYTGASAVPEPSTYALLAGLAALGGAFVRRVRRARAPRA